MRGESVNGKDKIKMAGGIMKRIAIISLLAVFLTTNYAYATPTA